MNCGRGWESGADLRIPSWSVPVATRRFSWSWRIFTGSRGEARLQPPFSPSSPIPHRRWLRRRNPAGRRESRRDAGSPNGAAHSVHSLSPCLIQAASSGSVVVPARDPFDHPGPSRRRPEDRPCGGSHWKPLRSANSTAHRYPTRLFPSGRGWFFTIRPQGTRHLGGEVRMKLHPAELGRRSVQRRGGEVELSTGAGRLPRAERRLSDHEEVREVEVAPPLAQRASFRGSGG